MIEILPEDGLLQRTFINVILQLLWYNLKSLIILFKVSRPVCYQVH